MSGSHRCSPFASCHNNNGSYQCQCIDTYTGDGKTCRGKMINILTKNFSNILTKWQHLQKAQPIYLPFLKFKWERQGARKVLTNCTYPQAKPKETFQSPIGLLLKSDTDSMATSNTFFLHLSSVSLLTDISWLSVLVSAILLWSGCKIPGASIIPDRKFLWLYFPCPFQHG